METKPLVMERTYNAPVEKVWQALTDPDKMRKWYFEIDSFKPAVGYEFSFTAQCDAEDGDYLHLCKVTEVEPGRKVTYSWRYDGYEGISYVTFELFPENNNTLLVLTHKGLETFPALKLFARESFTEGWTEILGTQLKEFVENN